MFKNIVWDFDGTIFDTYEGIVDSLEFTLKEENIYPNREEMLGNLKLSLKHTLEFYGKEYDFDAEKAAERFYIYEETIGLKKMFPFPNLEEILNYVNSKDKDNYIYTHRGGSTNLLIDKYNLNKYFKDIVTKNHKLKRKPDGEGFSYIIDKYNLKKEETLAVGDRELDLLAAKDAGIKSCLFISRGSSFSKTANYTIDNLLEIKKII
ncbi:MAG: HAD-IA family hydrolase [Clostridiaceae bacterium]